MDTREAAIVRRTVILRSISRIAGFLATCVDLDEFSVRIDEIELLREEFSQLQVTIARLDSEGLTDDDGQVEECDMQFENVYFKCKAMFRKACSASSGRRESGSRADHGHAPQVSNPPAGIGTRAPYLPPHSPTLQPGRSPPRSHSPLSQCLSPSPPPGFQEPAYSAYPAYHMPMPAYGPAMQYHGFPPPPPLNSAFVPRQVMHPPRAPAPAPSMHSMHSPIVNQVRSSPPPMSVAPVAAYASPPMRDLLPRVQIPTFSGDVKEWAQFIELFNACVHEAPIADMVKYHHLRSSLKGDALAVIANIAFDSNSYRQAYDALNNRYSNKRLLASHHLNAVFSYKPAKLNSKEALQTYLATHKSSIESMHNLGLANEANFLMFFIAYRALDSQSQSEFDKTVSPCHIPLFEELMEFITNKLRFAELNSVSSPVVLPEPPRAQRAQRNRALIATSESDSNNCVVCNSDHAVHKCASFQKMSVKERQAVAKKHKCCFNCLGRHFRSECKSKSRCSSCQGSHHSMLHTEPPAKKSQTPPPSPRSESAATAEPSASVLSAHSHVAHVLLATAVVLAEDSVSSQPVRAVVDTGSQVCLVTMDCVRRLGLRYTKVKEQIFGVNGEGVPVIGTLCMKLQSRLSSFTMRVDALVLKTIPQVMSSTDLPAEVCARFDCLQLADPQFHRPGKIDLLLGASEFCKIMDGKGSTRYGSPSAVDTRLGWIIMGRVNSVPSTERLTLFTVASPLEDVLKRFWEVEEVTKRVTNPDDDYCEQLYKDTVSRKEDGRYEVALPFKPLATVLGSNRKFAEESYLRFEKKLAKSPEIYEKYSATMDEYVASGKMTPAPSPADYVIPQQVIVSQSTTTSVRTVFNASATSSTGVSLNDVLYQGPKLQQDLTEVLTSFRCNPIAVSADIKQMYLQIRVREPDCDVQRVFYRRAPDQPLQEYVFRTVIFGVNCSPFLALRTVQQLVLDSGDVFPLAADALRYGTYMDNITASCKDVEEARLLCSQLKCLSESGGFPLRKWASSHEEVLDGVPADHRDTPLQIQDQDDVGLKMLGLQWHPQPDTFSYFICEFAAVSVTKRSCLSYIARLFDPLGLLTPFIFRCKAFLQALWLTGVGWDDELPDEQHDEWLNIVQDVSAIRKISVPRYLYVDAALKIQLLGFCDASVKGYCAVVYLRCETSSGVKVSLVRAKSKVAPLKTMSIPRLELSAALLLSRLVDSLATFRERLPPHDVLLFSDSTIVLAWLKTPPYQLKTFVSHRIVSILEVTEPSSWAHVRGEENPADCGSRGLTPSELVNHALWWTGPPGLEDVNSFVSDVPLPTELPEVKPVPSKVLVTVVTPAFEEVFERFSSFTRLVRVFAYVLRFRDILKNRSTGPLSVKELEQSRLMLVRLQQRKMSAASYASLTPFVDQEGLLRVGGRLGAANLAESAKHPLLLPAKCHLGKLICQYAHLQSGHSGTLTTLAFVRRQYWLVGARSLIRHFIHQCVVCTRYRGKVLQPQMGALPGARVNPSRPFTICSTDFGGPFEVAESRRRKSGTTKGYLCIFVCNSTKAVHLEFVSSLSMEAYLAALDRMCARRGTPQVIYSDNGRNYVGASRHLAEVAKFLKENQDSVFSAYATRQIDFKFAPPLAPNFGGLHEAGIKSAKKLLKRMIGDQRMFFEEYATIFARIEAILNSRPLYDLPTDDNDGLDFLTPGHFLIGAPIVGPPETPIEEDVNLKCRWNRMRQTVQGFWKSWSRDYLHTQIQRHKWKKAQPNIQMNDLVFISDMNTAPSAWPLGRVVAIHPGPDAIVRVVDVKTQNGTYRRSVNKLVILGIASG